MSKPEDGYIRGILWGFLQHALVLVFVVLAISGLRAVATFALALLGLPASGLMSTVTRVVDVTSGLAVAVLVAEMVIWLVASLRPNLQRGVPDGSLAVGGIWQRDALIYGTALFCAFLVYRLHLVATAMSSGTAQTLMYAGSFVFLWEAVLLLSRHVSGSLQLVRQ